MLLVNVMNVKTNTVTIELSEDDAERVALSLHLHVLKLYEQNQMEQADEWRRIGSIIRKARFP